MNNAFVTVALTSMFAGCGTTGTVASKAAGNSTPTSPSVQPLPPALAQLAHCNVDTAEQGAGQMSFDIYIDLNAQFGDLQRQPGAVVQTGVPFFGDVSVLFTTAHVTLDKQAKKLKVEVSDGRGATVINADLSEVNGAVVGTGTVDLGAKGSAPLQCKINSVKL